MNDRPAYAATEQHVQALAEKRERLGQAQMEAEQQLIQAVAREWKAGNVTWHELDRVYVALYGKRMQHFPERWNTQLPDILRVRRALKELAKANEPITDSWSGCCPRKPGEPIPGHGVSVVYILFDANNVPCYVGSSAAFRARLYAHTRQGKRWARWQAHRCDDRDHAYEVERQFLAKFKPYLNKTTNAGSSTKERP